MEKLTEEIKSHTYKSRKMQVASRYRNFYPNPVGKVSKRPGRFSSEQHETIWEKFKKWITQNLSIKF